MDFHFTLAITLFVLLFGCTQPKEKTPTATTNDSAKAEISAPVEEMDIIEETEEVPPANNLGSRINAATIEELTKQGKEILLKWPIKKLDLPYEFYFPGIYFYPDTAFLKLEGTEQWALGTNRLIKSKPVIDSVTGLEYIDGLYTGYQLSTPDSILCWLTKGANELVEYANLVETPIPVNNVPSTIGYLHYQIQFRNKEFEFVVIESFEKSGMVELKNNEAIRVYCTNEDFGENDIFYGIRRILWAGDIDNDGNLDMLLELGGYCDPNHVLFKSDGNGDFEYFMYADIKNEPCGC